MYERRLNTQQQHRSWSPSTTTLISHQIHMVGFKPCGNCGIAFYYGSRCLCGLRFCDRACYEQAWRTHKGVCIWAQTKKISSTMLTIHASQNVSSRLLTSTRTRGMNEGTHKQLMKKDMSVARLPEVCTFTSILIVCSGEHACRRSPRSACLGNFSCIKGESRTCLLESFLTVSEAIGEGIDVEEAMSMLCARTWFIAFTLEDSRLLRGLCVVGCIVFLKRCVSETRNASCGSTKAVLCTASLLSYRTVTK